MRLKYDTPNAEKLRFMIESRGYSVPQFSRIVTGRIKRNLVDELDKKPNMGSRTLVKICRLLDISMDSLFSDDDENSVENSSQTVEGNNNAINGNISNTDLNLLRSENKALLRLIEEKDKRIEELKKHNADLGKRLDYIIELGQKQD